MPAPTVASTFAAPATSTIASLTQSSVSPGCSDGTLIRSALAPGDAFVKTFLPPASVSVKISGSAVCAVCESLRRVMTAALRMAFSSVRTVDDVTRTSALGFPIFSPSSARRALRLGAQARALGLRALTGSQRDRGERAGAGDGCRTRCAHPNVPARYSRVRSAFGAPNTCSAGPYSTSSPRNMNATLSATR